MSDETPTPAPETTSMGSLFLGIVEDAAQEATPEPAPAETPAPAAVTPEPVAPAPETPVQDDVPVWDGQAAAGAAFKAIKAELEEAKARAAYLAGLAEGRTPQQQAAETPAAKPEDGKPNPDDFTTDEAYFDAMLDYRERQAVTKAEAAMEEKYGKTIAAFAEQAAEQAWAASMSRAEAQAGATWADAAAYANHMQRVSPGFAQDLLNANDPGRFVLETFKLARGQAAAPAPTPAPAPVAGATIESLLADPAQREAALRILAAQNAAKGLTPSVPTGPMGVGSGPGALGVTDGITVQSIRATNNPQKLEETRAKVFGAWIGEGFDT